MVLSKAVISYAQNREDLTLAALLYDVNQGTYIDIGANHPETDSVTKYFYDKGWTGVNVEPIESLHRLLVSQRPKDINLKCGISNKNGTLIFREFTNLDGHSTFSEKTKSTLDLEAAHEDYEIPVVTLETLFKEQNLKHIHFLKIDVEGLEYEVIKGNNWDKYRPEVICIEADHAHQGWKHLLDKNRYTLVVFDGLNEYYLANESLDRMKGFSERIVAIGHNALKKHQYIAWKDDYDQRRLLTKTVSNLENQLGQVSEELRRAEKYTLRGKSASEQIKLIATALRSRIFKKR